VGEAGAVVIMFGFTLLGWMIFREHKTTESFTRADFALRFGGFVVTLLTSCGLSTLHFSDAGFNETAGGIVGQIVGDNLAFLMKLLGASTLLFCLWVASLSLFLGISWINVMDKIGHWCLVGYEKAMLKFGELRDKAEGRRNAAARQDVVKVEKKLKAARPKPRIEPTLPSLEPSVRAEKERQVPLFEPAEAGELPPLSLLDDPVFWATYTYLVVQMEHCDPNMPAYCVASAWAGLALRRDAIWSPDWIETMCRLLAIFWLLVALLSLFVERYGTWMNSIG